ncbi:GNAT family N-acetyltransferase [Pleomorphovibrio marinus]|uniref:GNAT family N-acetyltransferase n=1 Tax=Pleomorphovibrio marinus TaxID=2164132 RepID=UPI000E0A5148|nr:GNAT family N-acetyltransferase [Pleomorphovibrio marinus]
MSKPNLSSTPISLQPMRPQDLEVAMALKNAEGWNQTLEDWNLFLQCNPDLCLGAKVKDRLVGTVTALAFEQKVAWISMMLVQKEYRGRGISKLLLKEIIERLGNCSSIKLDATPAGYPVYESLGFVEEFALARYVLDVDRYPIKPLEGSALMPIQTSDLKGLIQWDSPYFGANRSVVLNHLHSLAPELAWYTENEGEVLGYVLGRPGTRFTQIGPLVAKDSRIANQLLFKAVSQISGGKVVMDLCKHQTELVKTTEGAGFEKQRDLYRMYFKSNAFAGRPENYFLVAGPELG